MNRATHVRLALLAVPLFAACGGATPGTTDRLRVVIAPLDLPGLGVGCYDVAVTTPSGTVWSKGDPSRTALGDVQTDPPDPLFVPTTPADADTVCSDDFGNRGGGDIAYVGPCDASPGADSDGDSTNGVQNTVTIWVDGLYDATRTSEIGGWQDPCPTGCSLQIDCNANEDSLAAFDLTIMRQAHQGFFDVAVNFDDIFCSAKFDTCYPNETATTSDDEQIELLFGDDQVRDWTGVFGFACTGGPDSKTTLAYGDIVIACAGGVTFTIDPTLAEGSNHLATSGPNVLHYGIYRGNELLDCDDVATTTVVESCAKRYWNLAFDLEDLSALSGCTLTLTATATDDDEGFAQGLPIGTGVSYPYVDVLAELGDDCQHNALGDGGAVATVYHGNIDGMPEPAPLCHQYDGVQAAPVEGTLCSAEFCGGSGTETDPYLICTLADLAELDARLTDPGTYAAYTSAFYRQVSDLDFGGEAHAFLPIGDRQPLAVRHDLSAVFTPPSTRPFLGSYDGAGHHIEDLLLASPNNVGVDHLGLFVMLGSSAVIEDLIFDSPRLDLGDTVVAGTVAAWSSGSIEDVVINDLGADLNHVSFVGGVVGIQSGGPGLEDVYVEGVITGRPGVSAVQDANGLPVATTNHVGGVAAVIVNLAPDTTAIDAVSAHVDINVGGRVGGVATLALGNILVDAVESHGDIASGVHAAGIFTGLASAAALGVPGLPSPLLHDVVNFGSILVSGSPTFPHTTGAAGIALDVNDAILTDVHNRGDVANLHVAAGGAAGLVKSVNAAVLSRVSSTGDITNRAEQVDGDGNPSPYSDVAGLIGYVGQTNTLQMTDCYATGVLTAGPGENDIGGLVADIWDLDTGSVSVTRCYAANTFSGGDPNRGAAIGRINVHAGSTPGVLFEDIYWHTVTGSPTITTGYIEDAAYGLFSPAAFIGLTTAEMQDEASFGFDFSNIWLPPTGGGYPLLR